MPVGNFFFFFQINFDVLKNFIESLKEITKDWKATWGKNASSFENPKNLEI